MSTSELLQKKKKKAQLSSNNQNWIRLHSIIALYDSEKTNPFEIDGVERSNNIFD